MHNPLEQFNVKPLFSLFWNTVNFSFTNTAFHMLICCALIITFFFMGTLKESSPGRLQMLVELTYKNMMGAVNEYLGPYGAQFGPFVITLFCFILFGNLIGLIPYALTFTSQIIINLGLATFIIAMVICVGFKYHGFKFLRIFFPEDIPWYLAPIMIPVEIIPFLSRPISLALRLFANMMAGHTMIKVFAIFTLSLGTFGILTVTVNAALMAFEILIAFLQAYVFSVLACLYLQDAINLH